MVGSGRVGSCVACINRFAVGLRFDLSRVGSSARLVCLYHSTLFFFSQGI